MYRQKRFRIIFSAFVFFLVLGAPFGDAADPQPYDVTIAKTDDAALDAALTQSSSLIGLREKAPVGGFALVARAQDDIARLAAAFHSFGYYKADIHIRIASRPLDDPELPDRLDSTPAGVTVPIAITFTPGPLFHLRQVTLRGDVPADVRARLDLAAGQVALAAPVLAAQERLETALLNDGYAEAKVDPPVVVMVPDANALDVTYTATTGPRVDLGPISFAGLKRVDESFVRRRLLLREGERYDPRKIEKARQDLASLGVFSAVRTQPAPALDSHGRLPVVIDVTERPRHVVSITGAFSTDQGGSLTTSWSDRNLFGNAETLTLSAAATELGGSDSKQPGYNVSATFIKPDWLLRDQALQFNVTALKEALQAYDRIAYIAGGSVSRKLSPDLTVSLGLTATQEKVIQEDVTRNYTLLALPVSVKFDSTGSLFDPVHGFRAQASVTPTESLGGTAGNTTFVITQLGGSTYLDFGTNGRSVLALRALVGSAGGASQFELPPDQRFYAGGSATVRGYKYQYVGPQFADHNPQGGTAIDAATIEFRQRFLTSFGAVAFVDAGQVGTGAVPFHGPLRIGVGVGARYYTPIGPIRLDFALPLSRVPGGDSFEFYIGIGQAF